MAKRNKKVLESKVFSEGILSDEITYYSEAKKFSNDYLAGYLVSYMTSPHPLREFLSMFGILHPEPAKIRAYLKMYTERLFENVDSGKNKVD
jgi:hypothetical protein